MKDLLSDLNLSEIKELIAKLGEPEFRALQLYRWINSGVELENMTNIPKILIEKLSRYYDSVGVKILNSFLSKDKSKKYLFLLRDGNVVEGILMPHSYGNTLCLSTQAGCRMNCAFCASGISGLERNLSSGEMLGEVIAANLSENGDLKNRKITNLVLMGSGEPLDNYEQVTKFLKLVTHPEGLNMSERNISLSTCGLVDKIYALADSGHTVTLSISLHSAVESVRNELIPASKANTLTEIKKAAKYYFDKTGRRVIYEYILIKDKNDSKYDAEKLAFMAKGFPVHVNLIMLNPVKEKNLLPCSREKAEKFLNYLKNLNVSVTMRHSFGTDIGGACGQLRRNFIQYR